MNWGWVTLSAYFKKPKALPGRPRLQPRVWYLLVVLAVFLPLAASQFSWTYYLIGILRRDSFYAGWPTCYWSWQIWLDSMGQAEQPSVLCADPDAIPVLLELAHGSNTDTQVRVIDLLLEYHRHDDNVVGTLIPILIHMLAGGETAQCKAADFLARIGPRAKDAIPALQIANREFDGRDDVLMSTGNALHQIDSDRFNRYGK